MEQEGGATTLLYPVEESGVGYPGGRASRNLSVGTGSRKVALLEILVVGVAGDENYCHYFSQKISNVTNT
ncbi:hypothetical protein Tco_0189321 [Tanacetum coccineum]